MLGESRGSLIPRPSHRPVFDCLQYAKNGGGSRGPFYCVNDISVYLDRQREERGPRLIECILCTYCLF